MDSIESMIRSNAVIIATIAILIGILIVSSNLFGGTLNNPRITYKEQPLLKNKDFQLQAGDEYVYSYLFNGSSVNITYVLFPGGNCTDIRVLENQNSSDTCVGSDGTDSSGFNTSLSNPGVILFQPWMLALKDGWTWNSSMYLTYDGGEKYISDTSYRVVRTETYTNRTSFVVEIQTDGQPPDYEWIDADKRILLRILGTDYEVQLVDELSQNDTTNYFP